MRISDWSSDVCSSDLTCLICSARLLVIGGKMATHAERANNDFRSTVGQPRHASESKPAFFARWFMSTNHKDIVTRYLIFSILAGIIGATMSGLMRQEARKSTSLNSSN